MDSIFKAGSTFYENNIYVPYSDPETGMDAILKIIFTPSDENEESLISKYVDEHNSKTFTCVAYIRKMRSNYVDSENPECYISVRQFE